MTEREKEIAIALQYHQERHRYLKNKASYEQMDQLFRDYNAVSFVETGHFLTETLKYCREFYGIPYY